MDHIDRKILGLLQEDASLSVSEVASRVGLSTTPCWKRIHRLREDGVIERQVVLCNPERLGVATNVFVQVRAGRYDSIWHDAFLGMVLTQPEVIEVYRMSGNADYLLRVAVSGVDAYAELSRRLVAACSPFEVHASFALEQLKYTTALPVAE